MPDIAGPSLPSDRVKSAHTLTVVATTPIDQSFLGSGNEQTTTNKRAQRRVDMTKAANRGEVFYGTLWFCKRVVGAFWGLLG